MAAKEGWYTDPAGKGERYWTGSEWTSKTREPQADSLVSDTKLSEETPAEPPRPPKPQTIRRPPAAPVPQPLGQTPRISADATVNEAVREIRRTVEFGQRTSAKGAASATAGLQTRPADPTGSNLPNEKADLPGPRALVAIVGAILMIIGLFQPWVKIGRLTANAFEDNLPWFFTDGRPGSITDEPQSHGLVLLVIALLIIVISVAFGKGKLPGGVSTLAAVAIAITAANGARFFSEFSDFEDFPIGFGMIMSGVGALLVMFAGSGSRRRRKYV